MRRLLVVIAVVSLFLGVHARGTAKAAVVGVARHTAAESVAAPLPTLRRGSTGAAVSELQRRLNVWIATSRAGLKPLAVSGVFGVQTDAAVRKFQAAKRLRVTGVVAADTWAALPALPTPAPVTVRAEIKDLRYLPDPLRVRVGTTVQWVNADVVEHSVTHGRWSPGSGAALGGAFDSGLYGQGKSWSYKFTRVGQYSYFCTLHPVMQSMVVVTP